MGNGCASSEGKLAFSWRNQENFTEVMAIMLKFSNIKNVKQVVVCAVGVSIIIISHCFHNIS